MGKIRFEEFNNDTNWVSGNVEKYKFEAKIFNEGSDYGINRGRVSKLTIIEIGGEYNIVIYDRGWVLEPSEDVQEIYEEVLNFLEKSPKRDFEY